MIRKLFLGLFFFWLAAATFAQNGQNPQSANQNQEALSEHATWIRRLKLSGTLDGEFRYMRYLDIANIDAGSASDLYLRLVDLGIETALLDWVNAIAVLNSEWIGDSLHAGDEKITMDEVHFDLRSDKFPLYLVFGKRTQPFGLFENYLITDPLTQDAYETKKVGLSLGYSGPLGLDISLTPYKGTELMDHLFQSGLFDAASVRRILLEPHQLNSFILSGLISPFKDYLTLFASLLSEPGADRRNITLNTGFSLTFPAFKNLLVDGEYMKALQRETYSEADHEFREGAFSITAAYQFTLRERKLRGSGNYLNRKSHIRSHPIEIAARYEIFDDDEMTRVLSIWSVKNKYSLGGRYTFYDDGKIFAYFESEFRESSYRIPPAQGPMISDKNTELYIRLGVDF